jgi:hypothetical protein
MRLYERSRNLRTADFELKNVLLEVDVGRANFEKLLSVYIYCLKTMFKHLALGI